MSASQKTSLYSDWTSSAVGEAGLIVEYGLASFGLQARLSLRDGDPDHWRRCYAWYLENGFTHFAVATIWCGATTLDEHLAALERFRDEVGVLR